MLNLRIRSLFCKDIRIGRIDDMPKNIQEIVRKINENKPVNGHVFRPTPDKSLFMTFFFGGLSVGLYIFFLFITGTEVFSGLSLILVAIFLVPGFYYAFFEGYWAPVYVEKNIDKFFVYIGEEGIIKKSLNTITYIPYNIIKGSTSFIKGYEKSLQLHMKSFGLFDPNLLTVSGTYLIYDLADYDGYDLRKMENLINAYVQKYGNNE